MKKFYMLMGAAFTAATAMALVATPNERLENLTLEQASFENVKVRSEKSAVLNSMSLNTRAGETVGTATVNSPTNIFFFGLKSTGSYYALSLGFTPAWGKLSFTSVAQGATAYKWNWSNGFQETSPSFKTYEADGQDLNIDIIPGELVDNLTLTATNGDASTVATALSSRYFQGGSPKYWSSSYDGLGLTMYPCLDYKEDGQYMGTSVGYMSIDKTPASAANYDSNGAFKDWARILSSLNTGSEQTDITDIVIDGFAYEIPAMSSPYIATGMNVWANATFSEATVIEGAIYEVKNNAIVPTPIAKIRANVAAGSPADNIVFDFITVDEDGDEVDDDLIIDNKTVLIRIEGLSKNAAVQKFTPVYGNGTLWPVADVNNSPWYRNSYISMNYKCKGEDKTFFRTCPVNYYKDDARTEFFLPSNFLWSLDVNFPFVKNADTNGKELKADIPVAGGDVVVNTESTWNLAYCVQNELIESKIDGDWIKCTFGAADNGIQPITVSGTALPSGVEGRTGTITFTGMGSDFTINVTQGKVSSGVNDIVVDAEAAPVYYDLQGRKVVGTPDKGVYIVKQGNKVSKVIL